VGTSGNKQQLVHRLAAKITRWEDLTKKWLQTMLSSVK
jgi:hypothetical protein